MKKNRFSIRQRLGSFKHALNGLKILILEEHNSRIHVFATGIVIALGFILNVSSFEWMILVLCFCLVIALEIINSAIENLCDIVSDDFHPRIKKIKDLSASAVLISAISSIIVGLIIFIPKF